MHFLSTVLTIGLASLAVSSPLALPDTIDLSKVKLVKRDDVKSSQDGNVPQECSFLGPRLTFNYQVIDLGGHGTACIGAQTGVGANCPASGGWTDQDYSDIVSAVNQQVTKDGALETSEVGDWTVNWFLGNSAVPDQTSYSVLFQTGLEFGELKDEQYKNFFFGYNNNYIAISHKLFC
ncbi:hypothetical protein BT63DRAFT_452469 [Microthyrium microscopicum]|uniref:Uncharacterized protein n=1 Tax=Microthyrium microscopicum TaxID=703497 RepID=A0A6A6UI60_9PEZI|nr:hypothetical protein BT63DRAFT_452469 [Microthyrium microscopicum]